MGSKDGSGLVREPRSGKGGQGSAGLEQQLSQGASEANGGGRAGGQTEGEQEKGARQRDVRARNTRGVGKGERTAFPGRIRDHSAVLRWSLGEGRRKGKREERNDGEGW